MLSKKIGTVSSAHWTRSVSKYLVYVIMPLRNNYANKRKKTQYENIKATCKFCLLSVSPCYYIEL